MPDIGDPTGIGAIVELVFYVALAIGGTLLLASIANLIFSRPRGSWIALGVLDLLFAAFCLYGASLIEPVVPLIVAGLFLVLGVLLIERTTRSPRETADAS